MVQTNALIRKLPAVETLGSVTAICTDKTGTLTMNRMSVEQLSCDGVLVMEAGRQAFGTTEPWQELMRGMALSNDVTVDANNKPVGDPTEVALFAAAGRAGFDKFQLEDVYKRVGEIPFDSSRKCMSTIHADPHGGYVSITNGAAEVILERAKYQIVASDTIRLERERVLMIAERMANDGLRVIAFAQKKWAALPGHLTPEVIEQQLSLIGLVGIGDPIRQEALEAVGRCQDAGIMAVMITGDHPATARAIARQLGIIDDKDEVITGRELAGTAPDELTARVEQIRVYARVAPEQKLSVVRALQARGHVVAMTGDGVNDAPALKQAEIGVAMGITGTDVSKEASSMILLDDNFATIVRAVREGRKIYDNLRRFVRYAVTTNSSEVATMFVAPLLGLPVPLLPLQILWINLVTDGLPGLALAAEPEERNSMRRPPRPPQESVFAHGLGAHVIWVGSLMALVAIGVQAGALAFGSPRWQTMVLSVIAFSQLAHVLAIRSESESLFSQGLLSNKPLLGAVILTAGLQLAVTYVPVLNKLFNTSPLTAAELGVTLVLASSVFLAVEVEKWLRCRRVRITATIRKSSEVSDD
jgi:Ca2+-transporting ATPase